MTESNDPCLGPHLPMPRYDNLNDSEKTLVDNILKYDFIAEECAAYLRQHNDPSINQLWEEQQAIFLGDPATYPSKMASNTEGRNLFREKCEALFFPVGSERPLRDYVRMYFGAAAGMQLAYQEAVEYPHRNDLCRIANRRSFQIHSNQPVPDEPDYKADKAFYDPAELLDENIRCRDSSSGEIIEYVVIDYISSLVEGDYFVLEDQKGGRRNVPPEELEENFVDRQNSID